MSVVALEKLLDRERALLLEGDIDGVHGLIAEKEALLRGLRQGDGLAPVRDRLARNATLLGAAAAGIRAAKERVAEVRSGTQAAQVYGPDGARASIGGTGQFRHRS